MNLERLEKRPRAEYHLRKLASLCKKRDRLFGLGTTDETRLYRDLIKKRYFFEPFAIKWPQDDPDGFLKWVETRLEGWEFLFDLGDYKTPKYREAGKAVREYLKHFKHTRLLGLYCTYSDGENMAKGQYSYLWDIPLDLLDDFIGDIYTEIEYKKLCPEMREPFLEKKLRESLGNAMRVAKRAERIDKALAQGLIAKHIPEDIKAVRAVLRPYHIPSKKWQDYIDDADIYYWQWCYNGNRL